MSVLAGLGPHRETLVRKDRWRGHSVDGPRRPAVLPARRSARATWEYVAVFTLMGTKSLSVNKILLCCAGCAIDSGHERNKKLDRIG